MKLQPPFIKSTFTAMDNEYFRFVCQFLPVQVLATMPLSKLLTCQISEIRALARYVGFDFGSTIDTGFITRLQFFCELVVDQEFIVLRPDHDYRLFLMNALRFRESPQYLLNMDPQDISKCTSRQLHLLLKHLRLHVRRCPRWPTEFKQLFFNTIACGGLFPVQNLVLQLEKIFKAPEFVLDSVPVFEKTLSLALPLPSPVERAEEIIFMFETYDWISSEPSEARIIALGFGLDPTIFWPSAGDYRLFCRAAQAKQFLFSSQTAAKQQGPLSADGSCFMCCASEADAVRIPCGHMLGCFKCEIRRESSLCGICRQPGTFYKVYKP